jgi:hypothetical protein
LRGRRESGAENNFNADRRMSWKTCFETAFNARSLVFLRASHRSFKARISIAWFKCLNQNDIQRVEEKWTLERPELSIALGKLKRARRYGKSRKFDIGNDRSPRLRKSTWSPGLSQSRQIK